MEKIKFKRNQKVYSENQPINKVYIVWKGEFETEARLHKRED
jgi:CRP-like cAMP-binding protein